MSEEINFELNIDISLEKELNIYSNKSIDMCITSEIDFILKAVKIHTVELEL